MAIPPREAAAASVLAISMPMVSGPTPPGTGVMAPAISATSGCTSPDNDVAALVELLPVGVVTEELFDAGPLGDPVDTDIDHGGARPNEILGDHGIAADGDDEDVRPSADAGQVLRAGVADGDRGVPMHEQRGHRFADDLAATDDDGVLPRDLDTGAIEHLHDAGGRCRYEPGPVLYQQADVLRVEPIDVLVRGSMRSSTAFVLMVSGKGN